MSNPIRQHYIPRSYLKNFATKKDKKIYLVDAYNLEGDSLNKNISTKDICLEKHIYTIETNDPAKKFALEKYYADNVDSEYPNIYKILTDKSIKKVDKNQKWQILYVCLSLYFRTPHYLNQHNKITNEILDNAIPYANKEGVVTLDYFGKQITFHKDEIEEIKKDFQKENKTIFHVKHLEQWMNFVHFKYGCVINVIEIEDKSAPLITCDNPVSIRHMKTNKFVGLFDVNSVITLPLDPYHFLEIHPNTYEDGDTVINRLIHDKDFTFTTNGITQSNASNWLIGKSGTIDIHFKIQEHYEKSENGEEFVDKAKFRAEEMQRILTLTESEGFSENVINEYKKLEKHPYFKDDKNLKRHILMMKAKGLM